MANRYRSQVREVINRNTVVSLALEDGLNAFLPVYDGGVDFVLYRERDGLVRKVQVKSRWTIERKYIGRDIWIAFLIGSDWYLMRHDDMLAHAEADGVTQTASWIEGGSYSRPRPSAALVAHPNGPKAPGMPGPAEGFADPKGGARWVPSPNAGKGDSKYGWLDSRGRVRCPIGKGGLAHGTPHWDVQFPNCGYRNVRPGRNIATVRGGRIRWLSFQNQMYFTLSSTKTISSAG